MTTTDRTTHTDPAVEASPNADEKPYRAIPWEEIYAEFSEEDKRRVKEKSEILLAKEDARRELLVAWDKTRARMAKKLDIARQAELPRVWQDSDVLLRILREYVEAEGGTLRIVAEYPDKPPLEMSEIGELAWWGGDGDEWDYVD